jgi:spermidine synthase
MCPPRPESRNHAPMTTWRDLAQAALPGGDVLTLRQRGTDFEIRLNLNELMSTRNPASERALARLACEHVRRPDARILIGGLGVGYTARAVLDEVGPEATVTVAELVGAVIDWNRGPLGEAAGRPLDDPRLRVIEGDVADVLRASPEAYDVILMDVDNGPEAVLLPDNRGLYTREGLDLALRALRPGGIFALWAADRSPPFEAILAARGAGMWVPVPIQGSAGPVEHIIYLVRREDDRT